MKNFYDVRGAGTALGVFFVWEIWSLDISIVSFLFSVCVYGVIRCGFALLVCIPPKKYSYLYLYLLVSVLISSSTLLLTGFKLASPHLIVSLVYSFCFYFLS